MLIKEELIIELAKEWHTNEIKRLNHMIEHESKRLIQVEATKRNLDIISSRIIALTKLKNSISDIKIYVNLDSDKIAEFIGAFNLKSWSYFETELDEKNNFIGFSVTKENTNNPNILREGYVVSYDPYIVKDKNNIDIEEIVNEVAKKISESLKAIKN